MGSAHPWRLREGRSHRLPQAGQTRGSPLPHGRSGTTGTEGTAGKAASKAAAGLCLRGHRRDRAGMAAEKCQRAELSPLPAHPRALRTPPEGMASGAEPAPLRASRHCPHYLPCAQPHGGHPGPGVELHAGRHGSGRECCPVPPAEPLTMAGPCPPRPGTRPPGTATPGWAGLALLLPEPPPLQGGLRAPSERAVVLVITGEDK